jgi:DNA-binding transcriptional MerR regulator
MASNANVEEQTYRIGAIARLTGIPTDTLRVWERRYGVVTPLRSETGVRLYRREDVARLALIRRLIDAGHAIGSVAHLGLAELEERLAAAAPLSPLARAGRCRVAVVGEVLAARLRGNAQFREGLEVLALERDTVGLTAALAGAAPDVLVIEYPSVHEETHAEVARVLQAVGAARALVVYGFGRAESVRRLDTSRVTPLRAPVDPHELRRWCLAGAGGADAPLPAMPSLAEPPAPRRFDSETLARLAGVSTTVRCECPHHLVHLVLGLTAFEEYSAQCESRSPEDAALHAYLYRTTARARWMMEEALARLVEAEGLGASGG